MKLSKDAQILLECGSAFLIGLVLWTIYVETFGKLFIP